MAALESNTQTTPEQKETVLQLRYSDPFDTLNDSPSFVIDLELGTEMTLHCHTAVLGQCLPERRTTRRPTQLLCPRRRCAAIRTPDVEHDIRHRRINSLDLLFGPRNVLRTLWKPSLFLTKAVDGLGSVFPSDLVSDCEVNSLFEISTPRALCHGLPYIFAVVKTFTPL